MYYITKRGDLKTKKHDENILKILLYGAEFFSSITIVWMEKNNLCQIAQL